jgi:hypothetical protein
MSLAAGDLQTNGLIITPAARLHGKVVEQLVD